MSQLSRRVLLLSLPLLLSPLAYAAKPVALNNQAVTALHGFMAQKGMIQESNLIEFKRSKDFNNTLHIRFRQTYQGYPVFGADAVMHVPHANTIQANQDFASIVHAANKNVSMNGQLYQSLANDLINRPANIASAALKQKALDFAVKHHQQQLGAKPSINDQSVEVVIFTDQANKAHWAYKVSFFAEAIKVGVAPTKPVYILDANSFDIYKHWDNIKTQKVATLGGGFGGNVKMGKLVYDGLKDNLRKLDIMRDDNNNMCYLQNKDVTVKKYTTGQVMSFACDSTDAQHDHVFWDGDFDAVNSGYSPANDALHAGAVIKHMYKDWYGMNVLENSDGSPMMLNMVVHYPKYDNAYWDGRKMTFGDGERYFYPLTSLGVAAHEVSHGFTEQHSDLYYSGQSGGMNEAFSDMAAQAAEIYSYGPDKNSWQIGPEIFKAENEALRYMDQPSKDCHGDKPGNWCSIDDASQYTSSLDVHYSSGVYNHFFYFLGTTDGWDVKKAFDVMVHANANYWTSNTTFVEGACGVISAAKDYGYDIQSIKTAFDKVKVDYSKCDKAAPKVA